MFHMGKYVIADWSNITTAKGKKGVKFEDQTSLRGGGGLKTKLAYNTECFVNHKHKVEKYVKTGIEFIFVN